MFLFLSLFLVCTVLTLRPVLISHVNESGVALPHVSYSSAQGFVLQI